MSFSSDIKRMFAPLHEGLQILKELDGEAIEFKFDPLDPASVDAAISEGARWVDERLGAHSDNPIVASAAASFKEQIAERIRGRAAELRGEASPPP